MARFRNRSFLSPAAVRAAPRRKETVWFSWTGTGVVLTATGGTITHSLNAAALALRPFTVIRARMQLFLRSDQAASAEDQAAAFGMCVVSDQAVAIGVTAVPTPVTDLASDLWFVHRYLMASYSGIAGGARGIPYEVDSKAMRKVDLGQDLISVAEVDLGIGAGVTMFIAGRILVKVH